MVFCILGCSDAARSPQLLWSEPSGLPGDEIPTSNGFPRATPFVRGGTKKAVHFSYRPRLETGWFATWRLPGAIQKPALTVRTQQTQHFLVCGGTLFGGRVVAPGWPPCSVGGLTGLFGSCLVQKKRGWGRVWAATRPTGRDRTKKLEWL